MAPKKKMATTVDSLGAKRPVPVRTSSGLVTDRTRAVAREHQHRPGSRSLVSGVVRTPDDRLHIAGSKDGAGAPRWLPHRGRPLVASPRSPLVGLAPSHLGDAHDPAPDAR